jgi:hypothetical protein
MRGVLTAIAALALTACATSGMAPGTTTKREPVSEAARQQYRTMIADARKIHPYPESTDRMYAVMMCESNAQANIVNPAGPYTGLFQFSSATWNETWNSYRNQSMLDAKAQIFATALAWNKGMQSKWGCYKRTS